jgi:hypothetical protein
MNNDFFPNRSEAKPTIYAYEENNPQYKGLLKVGYTTVDVEQRVAQQYPTKRPDGKKPYRIVFSESAMYSDGGTFTDRDIHNALKKRGFKPVGGEWFQCTVNDLKAVFLSVKNKIVNKELRRFDFKMRPEQEEAVTKTIDYFKSVEEEGKYKTSKFLWNAKMRFGKTFATYQLARKMGWKKILVLTFKPAVETAWDEDLYTHVDFEGWQFISRTNGNSFEKADKSKPIICFGSFQDYLGTNENGGIKVKNEWVHTTNWDLVVFDEYHYGAWRENAKKLFEDEDEDAFDLLDIEEFKKEEADNALNESFLPISSPRYLYLSGTPFRAINSGEFIEDQIYNWTYSDEQRAKNQWKSPPSNPYESLPRMVMMTYKIPDSIRQIAIQGEFDEFDLNLFFSAEGKGENAKFKYQEHVQKWVDLIRGAYLGTTTDDLKLGGKKPEMPFSNTQLLSILSHTLWFLPNVASAYAMRNLLIQKQNTFFQDYKIIVAAGTTAGIGKEALVPVLKAMDDPLKTKTITLSCGKLTTGVTVKPWTGIFMLRNLSSPETYFQAAFRVQSPWEIEVEKGQKEIMKKECYIFDFALDRALKQISDYSCRLDINEGNPEKKVNEFISFLPVIAYDGSTMKQINANEILDIAMAGTSASLLARRFESALLVNVDNATLTRLMSNDQAMRALMNIEGFRTLNKEIETIINISDKVKKAKSSGEKLTTRQKKELTDEEKEYKSKRKLIQEKLIKFATRIPIFMYLTDYREYSLKDVITQLEPGLFKRVTGLDVNDFEILVSLGVFNGPLMNDAVYKFKRYEDSSLSYTGINKHEGENIGGFDTVISQKEYKVLYGEQQKSLLFSYEKASEKTIESFEKIKIIPKPKIENESNKLVISSLKLKDFSKLRKGDTVKHKSFGDGIIISLGSSRIIVKFGKAEKTFIFPDAFIKGYLIL